MTRSYYLYYAGCLIFVCIYPKVQHLGFGLYAYLNICLIYIVKILFGSAIS